MRVDGLIALAPLEGAGNWPALRVGRALTYADALTERRATEWMADADR